MHASSLVGASKRPGAERAESGQVDAIPRGGALPGAAFANGERAGRKTTRGVSSRRGVTGRGRVGDGHAMVTNAAGRWGGIIAQDYIERFADAYDREVQAWVDATRRDEVTGPSAWDGYAVAAVCEAAVRALEEGGRMRVELVERPALYA